MQEFLSESDEVGALKPRVVELKTAARIQKLDSNPTPLWSAALCSGSCLGAELVSSFSFLWNGIPEIGWFNEPAQGDK